MKKEEIFGSFEEREFFKECYLEYQCNIIRERIKEMRINGYSDNDIGRLLGKTKFKGDEADRQYIQFRDQHFDSFKNNCIINE